MKSTFSRFIVLVLVFLCLFGICIPTTTYCPTTNYSVVTTMTDYGTEYTYLCTGCNKDCVMSPDGNVWRCGYETLDGRYYRVVFLDNNTPDNVEDDLVKSITLLHIPVPRTKYMTEGTLEITRRVIE